MDVSSAIFTAASVLMLVSVCSASYACDDTVYCQGPLLRDVQTYGLYTDSKTFVDMEMTMDRADVLADYAKLVAEGPISKERLQMFVDAHFSGPGDELEPFVPEDWSDNPAILNRVHDEGYRKWILALNDLWKTLGRKVTSRVATYPDRHSLIYVPNPFIVPGGRFREYYYWDTYWIVKGLLVTGMSRTARMIIENFLHLVEEYGFIPNGGRVYFGRRSQPPLLIQMVDSYYQATGDLQFVRENFLLIQREYNFWIQNHTVLVHKDGRLHSMLIYSVDLTYPRPEGFAEDLQTVTNLSESAAREVYGNIASAAESGWDFSSRWFGWDGPNALTLQSIKTKKIVPVELNTYMIWNAKSLAMFAGLLDEREKELQYTQDAQTRTASLEALMWNEQQGAWFDYDIETHSQRLQFYPSNIFPLLIFNDAPESGDKAERVVQYLKDNGILLYPGGVPTSRLPTGQQWDMPNAWPPLISLIVNVLADNSNVLAQQAALNVSQTWLNSNYMAWKKYGHMFEKYDATKAGERGGGGEYDVQSGFGWTNGVILELIDRYTLELRPSLQAAGGFITSGSLKPVIQPAESSHTTLIAATITVFLIVAIAVAAFCIYRRKHREHVWSTQTPSSPC